MAVQWVAEAGKAPAGVVWHDGKLLCANMGSDHFRGDEPGGTAGSNAGCAPGGARHQNFPVAGRAGALGQ